MTALSLNRYPEQHLGGNCYRAGKDNRHEPGVGIQEHGHRHTGDVGREQEVDQAPPATGKARLVAMNVAVQQLEDDFEKVGCAHRHKGRSPGLFKAKHRVAENIKYRDRYRKSAESAEAIGRLPVRFECHELFFSESFLFQLCLPGDPSTMVCKPGIRFNVSL